MIDDDRKINWQKYINKEVGEVIKMTLLIAAIPRGKHHFSSDQWS